MKPIYIRIANDLIQKINEGIYSEGDMLPTEVELGAIYDVSRMTLRKALALLTEQDLLVRIKGSGTYIKKNKSAIHGVSELKGFQEEIQSQGKELTTHVELFEIIHPDAMVAERLRLQPREQVYHIERVRYINDEAEIFERTYLPLNLFPDLTVSVMSGSKYNYIRSKGININGNKQIISPELADKRLSKILNVRINHPLLKVISIGEYAQKDIFEYSINYFRLNQYSYEFYAR
ncbi:GntR family transcriptional regulator [Celerinatantimonas yamalensis]|uniref:GntR family transcriptional regulator n=1 Tax=Celerinatantimonas yamalensis TaxID=559956 RepID=A0ABW9G5H2_9GAMM